VSVREVMPGCSELIIQHLTVDDAGEYECRTVNHVGSDHRTATVDVGCELPSTSSVADPPWRIFVQQGGTNSTIDAKFRV